MNQITLFWLLLLSLWFSNISWQSFTFNYALYGRNTCLLSDKMNFMFLTSCIVRNGEKIIRYSTFPYRSWFYELSCVLSQLFLFPDCKELVYLISYDSHSMLMIILAGFLSFLMLLLQMIPHLTSISFHKDPESLVWKLGLTGLKWKPTYLISPLFFLSYGFFLQRKGIHRHEILQSVPLPLFHYTKLLNSLVHSSGTLMGKSNGVLSFKKKLIFLLCMQYIVFLQLRQLSGSDIHPINTLYHPAMY